MRGLTLACALAVAVSMMGTAGALHGETTDRLADETDAQLDPATGTFEHLVLPEPLQAGSDVGLEAAVPGPSEALAAEVAPSPAPGSVLDVDRYTDAVTLDVDDTAPDPQPTPDASTATGSGDVALDEATATDEADAEAEPAPMDEPATTEDEPAAGDDGATEASTASSLEQAWDERSAAEKAALGAGLLSLLALGPATLYSRIQRDDALENDTRRTVYEIVETNPGICIQDVADVADVSYSTASYHLDKLVRMDYLSRRKEGNCVLYYKNGGTFTQQEQELVPLLKNDEAMHVFQQILENPWCYRAEVAEALDVSHTTVNWHLDNLQEADLVEEHREGRSCHLHVPDEALERVTEVIEKLEELGVEEDYARVAGPVPA